MRRVVVTGLGLVTPLGADVETTWANILASKSGAGPITRFDASDQKCQIACEVKPADHEYGFDPDKRVDHKVQRQVDPFIIYGIDAAGQALEDAGLEDMSDDLEPGQPALRPRPPDQSDFRASLDQIRTDGSQPCRCDCLFHRCAFDWRCRADDPRR